MTTLKRPKVIAAIVLAVLAIVIVLQNTETVETKLLFATVSMPRATLLAVTFLLGAAAGALLAMAWSRRKAQAKS
jgi:uncharacterized integral membrane protein